MPHPHCAHVGSLLRPAPLLESLNSPDTGDAAALRKTEDAAIQQAIKLQRDIGLRTITDGELRRYAQCFHPLRYNLMKTSTIL